MMDDDDTIVLVSTWFSGLRVVLGPIQSIELAQTSFDSGSRSQHESEMKIDLQPSLNCLHFLLLKLVHSIVVFHVCRSN